MSENAGLWQPPEGWTYGHFRRASHVCGWTYAHPADDVGGFHAHIADHAAVCPFPELPELVETASD